MPHACKEKPLNQYFKDASIYFAFFVGLYIYQFLCLGLELDEVMDFYGGAQDTYTAVGRWGHSAYRALFGMGTSIWAGGICTALYLSLSYALQLRLFQIDQTVEKLIFLGFYLACPQIASMLGFMQHVDAIAFSLLLSTTAIYFFYKSDYAAWLRSILAILLLAIAVGCYQTCLFYALVLVLGYEVKHFFQQEKPRFPWARLSHLAALFIGAVIFWYILRSMTYPLASEQARQYATDYHSSRSQVANFFTLDLKMKFLYLAHYLKLTVIEAFGSWSPTRWIYMTAVLPLSYLMLLSAVKLRGTVRLAALAMLPIIWLLPFILILILGTEQPERTFLAEPLSLSVLWIIAWSLCPLLSKRVLAQRVMLMFLAFALVKTLYHTSAQERIRNEDYNRIVQDLQQMEQLRLSTSYKEKVELEVILIPVMEEEFDTLILMGPYTHFQRLEQFSTPRDKEQRQIYVDKLKDLPCWPHPQSIVREGDEMIIKYQTPWRKGYSKALAL